MNFLVCAFLCFTLMFSNPLSRSEEAIREDMLKTTPIGMSMEDVVDIVEENDDWTVEFYDDEIGVVLRIYQDSLDPLNNTPEDVDDQSRYKVVGKKSLVVSIGTYQDVLWKKYVSVYFAFDENDNLIDVFVEKDAAML